MSSKELPRATLSQLVARAVPYEHWRAPFDQKLQRLTWLAGAALVGHLLFLWSLPGLLEWSYSGFFIVLGGVLRGLLSWVAAYAPLLVALNVIALVIYGALVWRTRGLQAGTLRWQQVAFGEVVAGAAGAFPLAASFVIFLLNLLLLIVAICLFLGLLGALLSGSHS